MKNDSHHQTTTTEIIKTLALPVMGSITGLPDYIIADILSRLPTKSIFACRCVCKNWLNLTSFDPTFVDLHFSRSLLELLVQSRTLGKLSTTLHLVDPELECIRKMHTEIEIKHSLGDRENDEEDLRIVAVVNSCRGLLCLSDFVGNNPCAVCNPLTGEYIILPKPKDYENEYMVSVKCVIYSGLGFCPKTKQFKVLRMFYDFDPMNHGVRTAEIHVLGSDTWRCIGPAPESPYRASYAAYLNGALHWNCDDYDSLDFVVSFDFVSERFGKIPPPPQFGEKHKEDSLKISLGVLGECLYMCDATSMQWVDVWLMKEYGVQESWSKDYVIDMYRIGTMRFTGNFPKMFLRNGEMLTFYPQGNLVCVDLLKKCRRCCKFSNTVSNWEVTLHTPSFVSLKDVIAAKAKVLNLRRTE